jgi:hypothetical protein
MMGNKTKKAVAVCCRSPHFAASFLGKLRIHPKKMKVHSSSPLLFLIERFSDRLFFLSL